jgi:hydrogenase expression/formation protein HypC
LIDATKDETEEQEMCLAVPAEVVELLEDDLALIEIGGVRKEVSLMLVDGVEAGDFVLVHAGFAIEKVDPEEARKTLEILEEYARLEEN